MAKKHSMYDENPRMEHDGEGNVKVKRDAKKESSAGDTGEPDGEGLDKLIEDHKRAKEAYEKSESSLFGRIKKGGKGDK